MNRNPYLIQRLQKPLGNPKNINPFDFGGGRINGGFKKEVFLELQKIFRFDYMGSAEFEFGAVPGAFDAMLNIRKNKKLKNGILDLKKIGKTIYYICNEDSEDRIRVFLELLATKGDYYKGTYKGTKYEIFLKERTDLKYQLDKENKSGVFGWIDLDNHFMFFIDREMFKNSCDIYGLEVDE